MPNDSPFRNPPQIVRSILVAGVYALPGATLGMILALFLPCRLLLLAAGIVTGAVTGSWSNCTECVHSERGQQRV